VDRVSQSALENLVADMLTAKYGRWVTFGTIWSEVLLWSGMNRGKYAEDENPAKQTADMYAFIAAECERLKASVLGYSTDDLWFYSIGHLRELVAQVCAGYSSTFLNPAYADVQRGLYKLLDASSRATIMGVQAGWLEEGESYEDALKALQEALGGKKPQGL
jgi:hypothetical protein